MVSPDFNNPTSIALDSTLTTNYCELELSNAKYAWRVTASNDFSELTSSTSSFEVSVPTNDLSEITPVILAPANAAQFQPGSVVFWWEEIPEAESYDLLIMSPSFDNPVSVIYDESLEDTKVELDLAEGSYEWSLKAINSSSESQEVRSTLTVAP
ncbi:hypothetical protein [Reichenbachiella ulvae]|uniref:Fibronectin type-III domain-containing protein n=1 Tax=Reichenbachiella ulvae TaxID=2980104 RepID=A0ABT3CVE0_9BACT|nr:hypothetical protein [Reichenbachiella ulvae]MCV9387450.1 hypothetical protein [Reichenbachiella ulvae]